MMDIDKSLSDPELPLTTGQQRYNEKASYDHLWLRYPALDADRQRLDIEASTDELMRLPVEAQALLRIILRRLG